MVSRPSFEIRDEAEVKLRPKKVKQRLKRKIEVKKEVKLR